MTELAQLMMQHPPVADEFEQVQRQATAAKKAAESANDRLLSKAARLLAYHRELDGVVNDYARGVVRDPRAYRQFVTKWDGIDDEYRDLLRDTCEVAAANQLLLASADAVRDRPDALHPFMNPGFMPPEVLAMAARVGLTPRDLNDYFEHAYLPLRSDVESEIGNGTLADSLAVVAGSASTLIFPWSPQHLDDYDLITVGGDFFFLASVFATVVASLFVVAAAVVVVTAVVAVAAAVVAAALPVVATAIVPPKNNILQGAARDTKDAVVNAAHDAKAAVDNAITDAKDWAADTRTDADAALKNAITDAVDWASNLETDAHKTFDPLPDGPEIVEYIWNDLFKCPGAKPILELSQIFGPGSVIVGVPDQKVVVRVAGESLLPIAGLCTVTDANVALWFERDGMPASPGKVSGPTSTKEGWHEFSVRFLGSGYERYVVGFQVDLIRAPQTTVVVTRPEVVVPSPTIDLLTSPSSLRWVSDTSYSAKTAVETYGYLLANTNTRELHTPKCAFIHLIKPENLRTLSTKRQAARLGLDNCHYCLGGSTR